MNKYDKFATQLGFKEKTKDYTLLNNVIRTPNKDYKINLVYTKLKRFYAPHQGD
jgi:hypothetical protein